MYKSRIIHAKREAIFIFSIIEAKKKIISRITTSLLITQMHNKKGSK
jgi:hypothetical protein